MGGRFCRPSNGHHESGQRRQQGYTGKQLQHGALDQPTVASSPSAPMPQTCSETQWRPTSSSRSKPSTARGSISKARRLRSCLESPWLGPPQPDGRLVVRGGAEPVARDTNQDDDVFVRDLVGGLTTRVSVSAAVLRETRTARSGDQRGGRFVAFTSDASNLVAGQTNRSDDIFVHDLATGHTAAASVSSTGEWANGGSLWAHRRQPGGWFVSPRQPRRAGTPTASSTSSSGASAARRNRSCRVPKVVAATTALEDPTADRPLRRVAQRRGASSPSSRGPGPWPTGHQGRLVVGPGVVRETSSALLGFRRAVSAVRRRRPRLRVLPDRRRVLG